MYNLMFTRIQILREQAGIIQFQLRQHHSVRIKILVLAQISQQVDMDAQSPQERNFDRITSQINNSVRSICFPKPST